jgi:hypothetical protein
MSESAITYSRWRWYPAVHVVLFQLGWYACVRSAADGQFVRGPVVALLLIGVHLAVMRRAGDEIRLMGGAVMIGVVADSLLGASGLVRAAPFTDIVAPLWLLCQWALFAATLHTYCRWLLTRPMIASICGAIAGPCCYLAAERIGALHFPAGSLAALAAVALEWALVMPLMILWARRLDGHRTPPAAVVTPPPHA